MIDSDSLEELFRAPRADASAEDRISPSDSSPEAMLRLRDPFAAQPAADAAGHTGHQQAHTA